MRGDLLNVKMRSHHNFSKFFIISLHGGRLQIHYCAMECSGIMVSMSLLTTFDILIE